MFATGAVLLASLIWFGTNSGTSDANVAVLNDSSSALAVRGVAAREAQWPDNIEAFGNVVPWDEIVLSAQIAGHPLREVRAKVGDRVRKGDVLALFDAEMLRAEQLRLQAEVSQASAEVDQANTERQRARLLADSGGVSEQEVLQRDTAAQVAIARLASAQAQLGARELDLRRSQIVAPDDGTVSARNAQTGMTSSPGLELYRIIRRDRLEWRGELAAAQILRAASGQPVLLTLPGGSQTRARIRHVAPAMDMQTRLGMVYADIETGGPARAGTYVSGQITLGERSALVVPAAGVVVRDGNSFVFKLTPVADAMAVSQQRVAVGRRQGTEVEILSGLSAGERIVAQGAGFLDDGDRVRVVDDAVAAVQTGATP
ncbi:MAG: efflux RND transporter periplasmic adaptor subunit [Steroidobacteraceae bacterium]